jgi:hypothetical protein
MAFHVRSFWWLSWLRRGVRATTSGSVILIGPRALPNDFEHELVHIEQNLKHPLIQPILYTYQSLRHGYRDNKYEVEAYSRTNSVYQDE